jgi:hypothetical protein
MLLTSVYETGSRVPIPVFLEALIMLFAFNLISEAGLRAPGTLGNALGIVSGLILGQSAVSADIASPLLLIVVAASGLGGFCVPDYGLSIGLKIVQMIVLCAGAAGGLYLIGLTLLALLCTLCGMQSVTSPLTAPVAPPRVHNRDLLLRLPLRFQKARSFFAARSGKEDRVRGAWRVHAASVAVTTGASVYALGTLAAPICLSSVWLAALAVLPLTLLATYPARQLLLRRGRVSRAAALCLAAAQGAIFLFLFLAAVALVRETLLPRARESFILLVSAVGLILCAVCGRRGTARLAFAGRLALPLLLLALAVKPMLAQGNAGLFPMLGMGLRETALAAAAILPAALSALGLALPPPELAPLEEEAYSASLPRAGFFAGRLFVGVATAAALLMAMALCNTYEGIAGMRAWGERMIILSYGAPREGIAGTLLTLLQAGTLALSAVNALLISLRALTFVFRRKGDAA